MVINFANVYSIQSRGDQLVSLPVKTDIYVETFVSTFVVYCVKIAVKVQCDAVDFCNTYSFMVSGFISFLDGL